ncbi:Uncharacterised protein [Amycolatopsis camponoti]|uniref:Uncharacterized protein n=1 Tax=Amycolatopsis camponoti TaxID=2606593 RepID=A0A6I8M1P3_9PSEU|nr:Uncharacterised protein [Amycolatopsis camponoti]
MPSREDVLGHLEHAEYPKDYLAGSDLFWPREVEACWFVAADAGLAWPSEL